MCKGVYLSMVEQKFEDSNSVMEKHSIVEVFEPNEKGFVSEPTVRTTYLQKGVLAVLPIGTEITFDYGRKDKTRKDGSRYEAIVPINIKPVSPVKKTADKPA